MLGLSSTSFEERSLYVIYRLEQTGVFFAGSVIRGVTPTRHKHELNTKVFSLFKSRALTAHKSGADIHRFPSFYGNRSYIPELLRNSKKGT